MHPIRLAWEVVTCNSDVSIRTVVQVMSSVIQPESRHQSKRAVCWAVSPHWCSAGTFLFVFMFCFFLPNSSPCYLSAAEPKPALISPPASAWHTAAPHTFVFSSQKPPLTHRWCDSSLGGGGDKAAGRERNLCSTPSQAPRTLFGNPGTSLPSDARPPPTPALPPPQVGGPREAFGGGARSSVPPSPRCVLNML